MVVVFPLHAGYLLVDVVGIDTFSCARVKVLLVWVACAVCVCVC